MFSIAVHPPKHLAPLRFFRKGPKTMHIMLSLKEGAGLVLLLRIRSAHLEIFRFPIGDAYQYSDIFAWFQSIRKKIDLSKYYGYPKRKLGETMHF